MIEKIWLLEDKPNEDDDVEIFSLNLNKNYHKKEADEYQLIVCSKCKFKSICYYELKMHKASRHILFENPEYSISCKLCEKKA